MGMPGPPSASRGSPPLDEVAQQSIAAVRQQRPHFPPGYEPFPLSPEEKAEAGKEPGALVPCGLCAGYHHMPGTAACPRLASFELDGDGKLKSGTYWPGRKWAKGRVVFVADTKEKEKEGDDGA